ncbi:MAG: EAL domain-containing protein [Gammaproteobacteria bacterium]|nr:EAL domain-containing protein [Gammaproteobacteria bacterium]
MLLEGSYDYKLVLLSVLIAIFSSYTALNLISQLKRNNTRHIAHHHIGSSGLVLGLGIWSMHFVGMLAFSLPVEIHYGGSLTLLSLVVAIVATIAGLAIANADKGLVWLVSGGLLLGIGISSMHYIGMAAMQLHASMHHNTFLIILSVIVGVIAANVALWITFSVGRGDISGRFTIKASSAVIMGFAISGMHYIGMAAMSFHSINNADFAFTGFDLDPGIIGVVLTLAILLLLSFALWSSRLVSEANLVHQNEKKIRVITENLADIIMTINSQGIIEFTNASVKKIFGYQPHEVIGKNLNLLIPEPGPQIEDNFIQNYFDTSSITVSGLTQRELKAKHKNGNIFPVNFSISETSIENQQTFIGTIRDISERIEAQKQLHYLAHHDILTTLPNRHSFLEHVEHALGQAKQYQRLFAVLYLDLDRFKVINDTLGHDVGDRLLQEIATRLKTCIRGSDIIARISGDEFTVLLDNLSVLEDVTPIAQKIITILSLPYTYAGHELFTSASIGISTFPDDGKTASGMMRHADIAMYRAKSEGGNQYCFYSKDMKLKNNNLLQLESDLRHALERNEFELYYQPQVDIENSIYSGVEALLRWNHPKHGVIPPIDFIPLLEETGLIIPVGDWIIRTACEQAISWQKQNIPPIHIAVNLSARQFADKNLPKKISDMLQATGLEPEYLELEITENILMHQDNHTMNIIHELHTLNIQLAIDDFGTGYSSLSYLKKFPIHTLKIDRSFVRDITTDSDDAAIVQLIIDMAHSLKLNVVAEGVETREQILFLKEKKCGEMQGFFFSKPLPANEITEILRRGISAAS